MNIERFVLRLLPLYFSDRLALEHMRVARFSAAEPALNHARFSAFYRPIAKRIFTYELRLQLRF